MCNGWTPERRAKQSELIRSWRPWEQSTGPKTDEGKAASSRNAWQGGFRPFIRGIRKIMRDQDKARLAIK